MLSKGMAVENLSFHPPAGKFQLFVFADVSAMIDVGQRGTSDGCVPGFVQMH